MRIVLASNSPRRQELLRYIFPEFEVIPAKGEESRRPGEPPEQLVTRLALEKAAEVYNRLVNGANSPSLSPEQLLVIGGDTVVALENEIFGKPANKADAARMLRSLSGKTHQVYSGTAILWGARQEAFCCCSRVTFYPLTEQEIHSYLSTGEPMGKAGAYAIQGAGMLLVKEIQGSYPNIVGLPVAALKQKLKAMGMIFDK